jgi:hypothetical protein
MAVKKILKIFFLDQERVRRRAATEGRPYRTYRSFRFPYRPPGVELNSLRNNPVDGGSVISLSSTPDL